MSKKIFSSKYFHTYSINMFSIQKIFCSAFLLKKDTYTIISMKGGSLVSDIIEEILEAREDEGKLDIESEELKSKEMFRRKKKRRIA